jgi:hypothetical protein
VIGPVIIENLAEAFRIILVQAQVPYLKNANGSGVRAIELYRARAHAPVWLSRKSWFTYFFDVRVEPP